MDEQRLRERLHRAAETRLSGLQGDPWLAQKVMANAKGDKKVKKKLSVGLALVLILVLAATIAFAAVALQAYYQKAFETQNKAGYFQEWPLMDKIELVDRMIEANLEIDVSSAGRLHEDNLSAAEKEAIADNIVTGYYGVGHDGLLSVVNMMEKDMGEMATWSLEEKAWVSEQQEGAAAPEEVHIMPDPSVITQEQAILLASNMLSEQYSLSESDVASFRTAVDFMQFTDDSSIDCMTENVYQVSFYTPFSNVHPYFILLAADGTFLYSSRPFGMEQDINEVFDKAIERFSTPVDKALFHQQWSATIRKAAENGEKVWDYYLYLSTINYMMPDEKVISQETAQANAEKQICSVLGWSKELLMRYKPFVSLRRASDASSSDEQAIWYFKYVVDAQNVELYWDQQIPWGANVSINAQTGDAIYVEESSNSERYSMYTE